MDELKMPAPAVGKSARPDLPAVRNSVRQAPAELPIPQAPESLQQAVHDCNNHLACVLGLLSLARQLRPEDKELPIALADALSAAHKLRLDIARLFHARPKALLLALAAAFFLYDAAWAGGFKSLAKELSRAAHDSGIARVAVIPFEPVDASGLKDGRAIAEKLTTQLVRTGRVQAVERSLIGKLLDEHSLAKTGLIDQGTLKKLGSVLSVDGIVSGSFVTLGNRVLINARLINLETGLIVAACEKEAPREWFDGPGLVFVPAPVFTVEPPTDFLVDVPSIFPEEGGVLRDAVAEEDCAQASDRVDRMESMILELKARYWALRLKKGLSGESLKSNPGSTITDPELKKRFYDRMKFWHERGAIPELTPTEVKRFVAIDRRAFALHRGCGM